MLGHLFNPRVGVRCHVQIAQGTLMLGIGLQKQYCAAENKILKSRNELYEEQAKNNAIFFFLKKKKLQIRNTYLIVFKNKRPLLTSR
jgi:ApbE superfamily uncharacterized protein (UPF0280 family)